MDDFFKNNVNLENTFDIVFQNFSKLMTEKFKINKPTVVFINCPNLEKHNIQSRDFKSQYFNEEDKIGGNLYSWIHQSYRVLWEIDKETNAIVIYTKTIEKLGLRFATVLKMEKKISCCAALKLIMYLSLAEFSLKLLSSDIIINNLESDVLDNNLKNQYIFSLSKLALYKDIETLEVYQRFTKMFAKDVELFKLKEKI
jgi:hypothetical protein